MEKTGLRLPLWTSLLVLMAFVGCSSSTEELKLSIPEEIRSDGRSWKRTERTTRNKRDLDKYFRKHPELREHPLLGGTVVHYSDSRGIRRFYWILPAQGGHSWMYLEQDVRGGMSGFQEGSGAPFQ